MPLMARLARTPEPRQGGKPAGNPASPEKQTPPYDQRTPFPVSAKNKSGDDFFARGIFCPYPMGDNRWSGST